MDKGSKFIPCIHYNSYSIFNFILTSFDENFNSFNSRINMFHRQYKNDQISNFRNNNINICPTDNLTSCLSDKCKNLKSVFNSLKFPTSEDSLNFKFAFYKSLKDLTFDNNMNMDELDIFYMKKFNNEKKFKVIDCDKNVGSCFISAELYDEFIYEHLNNREIYINLAENPLEETQKIICAKLKFLVKNKHINRKIYQKLFNKNGKLGSIRLLAKIHKTALGFRPIINCLSHPTMFLCLLIDIIFQPFVKKTSSYIMDSQNLIQKSQNIHFPKNAKIYSCDFESLYTNIKLTHALTVICEYITRKFKSAEISSLGIYEILKLIFENNIFCYKNKYYKQISGIAMGAKCAPSIANLYIAILEENFLVIYKPLFYFRFIDDILVILDYLFDIKILTSAFGYLKLNVVSDEIVNFLDLLISLDANTGFLIFSLYTKPTNTFSYLLHTSNHPNFIFKNVPRGIFIRIRRICSYFYDYLFFSRKLTSQLVNRGYDIKKVTSMARTIGNVDRLSLLPYKTKIDHFNCTTKNIFFKFPFELNTIKVKTALNSAFNSISTSEPLTNVKFNVINTMQNNLSSIFVHEFKLFATKKFSYSKCRDPTCSVCFYANVNYYILLNGFYLPFMANSNCKTENILYILTYKLCKCYYIGQSINAKGRLKTHIRDIRLNRTSSDCVCVHKHFNLPQHDALKYFALNIFNINISNLYVRLTLETQLIHLFKRLDAKLINVNIPKLYFFNNVSLFANNKYYNTSEKK